MSSPLDLLFDGQCQFCRRVLTVVRALDFAGTIRFHDANDPASIARFPMCSAQDLAEAMFVVESSAVYQGFFAFRRLARALPALWVALPLFYAPGSSWLGPRIYAWVARNRRSLGCASEVCDLPPGRPRSPDQ